MRRLLMASVALWPLWTGHATRAEPVYVESLMSREGMMMNGRGLSPYGTPVRLPAQLSAREVAQMAAALAEAKEKDPFADEEFLEFQALPEGVKGITPAQPPAQVIKPAKAPAVEAQDTQPAQAAKPVDSVPVQKQAVKPPAIVPVAVPAQPSSGVAKTAGQPAPSGAAKSAAAESAAKPAAPKPVVLPADVPERDLNAASLKRQPGSVSAPPAPVQKVVAKPLGDPKEPVVAVVPPAVPDVPEAARADAVAVGQVPTVKPAPLPDVSQVPAGKPVQIAKEEAGFFSFIPSPKKLLNSLLGEEPAEKTPAATVTSSAPKVSATVQAPLGSPSASVKPALPAVPEKAEPAFELSDQELDKAFASESMDALLERPEADSASAAVSAETAPSGVAAPSAAAEASVAVKGADAFRSEGASKAPASAAAKSVLMQPDPAPAIKTEALAAPTQDATKQAASGLPEAKVQKHSEKASTPTAQPVAPPAKDSAVLNVAEKPEDKPVTPPTSGGETKGTPAVQPVVSAAPVAEDARQALARELAAEETLPFEKTAEKPGIPAEEASNRAPKVVTVQPTPAASVGAVPEKASPVMPEKPETSPAVQPKSATQQVKKEAVQQAVASPQAVDVKPLLEESTQVSAKAVAQAPVGQPTALPAVPEAASLAPKGAPVEPQAAKTVAVKAPQVTPKKPPVRYKPVRRKPVLPPVLEEPVPNSLVLDAMPRVPRNLSSLPQPHVIHDAIDIDRTEGQVTSLSDMKYDERESVGLTVDAQDAPKREQDTSRILEQAYQGMLLEQLESAIVLYKEVLAQQPRHKIALFGLATAYQKAGQNADARDVYVKLFRFYPDYEDAFNNYLVLVSEEHPSQAVSELMLLRERNPEYAPIEAQLGIVLMKQQAYEQAIEHLTRAVTLMPQNLLYRYNLAIAMDKHGAVTEARKLYQQVLDAKPEAHPEYAVSSHTIQERLKFLQSK